MMNTETANPAPRAALEPALQSTDRTTAALVGLLFLSSTATFAIGNSLIERFFAANETPTSLLIGVLLQTYTGLAVAAIGIAMLPVFKDHPRLARAYAALRILECLAIIGVGAFMLTRREPFPHFDALIYVFTAIGGIVFSHLLYTSSLIPKPLAALGLVGYVALLLGVPTALLGVVNLNDGWGMAFLLPGGLFELILPFWLFIKGFQVFKPQTA